MKVCLSFKKMLNNGLIINNTYKVINEIGSGGMGVVYLAYHIRLCKYVVLKKIKNASADISMLRNEVDVLKGLRHRYLPQVYDFLSYEGDLYTVIDYINGYDLAYYFNNGFYISEAQIIKWMSQLCEVLDYLHSNNIIHTDIKPANIIINESGDVCLIDFGISLIGGDTVKGLSAHFCSPEQYGNFMYLQYGQGSYITLDQRSDIYSLGATFYYILTGDLPDARSYRDLYIPPENSYCCEPLAKIINKAAEYQPERRFKDASQMLKAIYNIRKQDSQYKKYVLAQLLASLLAAVMIITGVLTMYTGFRSDLVASYEQEYSSLLSAYRSGDSDAAVKTGQSILNNASYASEINGAKKSEILHIVGDCYYEKDDFSNASYYYGLAFDCASDGNKSDFCCDYAIALAQSGDVAQAKQILSANESANDYSTALIEAGINFSLEKYAEVTKQLSGVVGSIENPSERSAAYIMLGDSQMNTGNYSRALDSYQRAADSDESVYVLRKLGDSAFSAGIKTSDKSMFKRSFEVYKKICNEYSAATDDAVNLAQACERLGDKSNFDECKSILLTCVSNQEDFRLYVMLTRIASLSGDSKISEYCLNAHRLYSSLSLSERELIDDNSLQEMKDFYSEYCNGDW